MKIIAHLVRALLCLALFAGSSAQAGGTSLCCPLDFDGDGAVGGADLAVVLGAWGPTSPGAPGDLDGSGQVDGSDLAILLGSWGSCVQPCLKTQVVGTVEFGDGSAVPGAVVVTDRGGQGVSGADGSFGFEVEVAPGRDALTVTAIATVRGVTYSGTKLVSPIVLDGVSDAGAITVSSNAPCDPTWLPTFGGRPGLGNNAKAFALFDDGSGPMLFVGGSFTEAGGIIANRIAKWDGASWSPLGSGLNGEVRSLAVFDDGTGPALYVGGAFTTAGGIPANRIAKWDGAAWSSLGSGMSGTSFPNVDALATFDDGSGGGLALYAGGGFSLAGGVSASRIAKWNGTTWSSLGLGLNSDVKALVTFDDGSGAGEALYVGGTFTTAGGSPANAIARWDGTAWSPLGTGLTGGTFPWVLALTTSNAGTGPTLYAGGSFTTAGGAPASRIAKWDGSGWSAMGSGVQGTGNPSVYALRMHDDGGGAGPKLIAGGSFTGAGGLSANRLATWNGTSWSALGVGADSDVFALSSIGVGPGGEPALVCGGGFTSVGGIVADRIAVYESGNWSPFGGGFNGSISSIAIFDDGSGAGPSLCVGGSFTSIGGVAANRIARWDGSTWSSLGLGVNGTVRDLLSFDDGSGMALYAGGDFTLAGGATANRIARWNGVAWSTLGSGLTGGVTPQVFALAAYGGAGGPTALYVGGAFTMAGGTAANLLAKWNGSSWSAVGSGLSGGISPGVIALEVFGVGSDAPALYVGGDFASAGGLAAGGLARWDGFAWTGFGASANGPIRSLAAFDDGSGSGPALYAGGSFSSIGGVTASRVAKWNGAVWSPLGSGMDQAVSVLEVHDDGVFGPALYAGGSFLTAGSVPAKGIARWNGTAWSGLHAGVGGGVSALLQVESLSGGPDVLYVGGGFATSDAGDSFLTRWGCSR